MRQDCHVLRTDLIVIAQPKDTNMVPVNKHFTQRHTSFSKRARQLLRTPLQLESLEDRSLLSASPGVTLIGPLPPSQNLYYGNNNQPEIDSNAKNWTGTYAQPGSNPFVGGNYSDINNPYIVNGSPEFNQPVQSSDWWSTLMFRLDPGTVTSPHYPDKQGAFAYGNANLVTEPAFLKFINMDFGTTGNGTPRPNIQGLGFLNPETVGINPGEVGSDFNTQRFGEFAIQHPLIVGIGGNVQLETDTKAQEISPLSAWVNGEGKTINDARLNVRINHYSDWAVQAVYGNAADPSHPETSTDSMTVDMINGSPFTYFTKTGNTAYTKVWLNGNQIPSSGDVQAPVNEVWGQGLLPKNVLGVTLTTSSIDGTGTIRINRTSYLVIASDANSGWFLDTEQTPLSTMAQQLYKNPMGSGKIVVVTLPHAIGSTQFEDLSTADKVSVAKLFTNVAMNFPKDDATATRVSDPLPKTETYNGQQVTFGYNPSTSLIQTKYSINTVNNLPTYQVLYPHQTENLLPSDEGKFLKFTPTSGPDQGKSVELSYTTLMGKAKVYAGNTFATKLTYHGLLDTLPSVVTQTDAVQAQQLFIQSAAYMTRYLPDPNFAIGPNENTYNVGLMAMGEQLKVLDKLASPNSLISDANRLLSVQWRDRLLQDLKAQLFSWFDVSTGRLFQLNTTYNSVIGYPAGYGSEFSLSDHHFHYGYFLNAFATVGEIDPAFTQAMQPQIELLIRDVANFDRTDNNLPFLREFNPWAGHSWADGLGPGGNNQEAATEAVNFAAGMIKLGMQLGRKEWTAGGVYLYETEIEAMNQYWFNTKAKPELGEYGNWPKEFVEFIANGDVQTVTQIANLNQNALKRDLFFASPNTAEALYAINWLPTTAHMLFLGRDQDYLKRNWEQFIKDNDIAEGLGLYESVVAAYQALLADQGFGLNQPGATNALQRLDYTVNPAIAPTDQTVPGNIGYKGSTLNVTYDWVMTLGKLGQVDTSVIADTTSYAVFVKNGQRTYVAANNGTSPITVSFKDVNSLRTLTTLIVQPGEMITRLADGRLLRDRAGTGQSTQQNTELFLTKPSDGNPSQLTGTLSKVVGQAIPTTNANTPGAPVAYTRQLDVSSYATLNAQGHIGAYANTYQLVPKRPGDATNIGTAAPADTNGIVSYSINNLVGNYSGGTTGVQFFFDNVLTWKDQPANGADPRFGNQFGPGVLSNQSLGKPQAVVEIGYDFDGNGTFDRVETYTQTLEAFNQFNIFDTMTPNSGIVDPNIQQTRPVLQAQLSNLQPFQPMANGSVRVRMWEGTWSTDNNSHKEFAVSVNSNPNMARSSKLVIPYIDSKAETGPSIEQVGPVAAGPFNTGINEIRVNLSQPAQAGTFTFSDLSLKRNGTAVALNSNVKVNALQDGSYQITGLAAFQTTSGNFVLTINGTNILNANGKKGVGSQSVSWTIDKAQPILRLVSDTSNSTIASPIPISAVFSEIVTDFTADDIQVANGTVSNFRGAGQMYAFDVTPSKPGVTVSVKVASGKAHDAAGNLSSSASISRVAAFTGPAATLSSTAGLLTNLDTIPVRATFSTNVTGFAPADLLARNATITDFTQVNGSVYTFNLKPTGTGAVSVDLPSGVANDSQNRPNRAAASLIRTFDNVAPTAIMTSVRNFVTYESVIPVTVLFSEAVTGFEVGDLNVANGTIANFQGTGNLYTFDLIPTGIGVASVNLHSQSVHDGSGNTFASEANLSRVYRVMPTASVTTTESTPTSSNLIPVRITFNQPMVFDTSRISIVNATISGPITSLDGAIYTFNVAPTNPGIISIVLPARSAFDAFGNANPDARLDFFNGAAPALDTMSVRKENGYYFVELKLTEVVEGFDLGDITIPGDKGIITDFNGGGNLYNFRVTPRPSVSDFGKEMDMTIQIAANRVVSNFGIPNQLISKTFTTELITGPTVVMTADVLGITSNAVMPITATFTQPVKGFSVDNIIAVGGSIQNFQGQDGDTVFTYDFVPDGVASNVSVVINTTGPTVVTTLDGIPVTPNPASFNRTISLNPVVVNVTSSAANGAYTDGATIPIQVIFDSLVLVSGTPQIALSTGNLSHPGVAYYTAGSGTNTLTFLYRVKAGENSAKLDYRSDSALTLQGGAITNKSNNAPVSLKLFVPGTAHSLSANKQIAIGNKASGKVTISQVTSTAADGIYQVGQSIPLLVKFSEAVAVTGTPRLALNLGLATGYASYVSGSGTDTLVFNYQVAAGQQSSHLEYLGTGALTLQGGKIDKLGTSQAAILTLPDPGSQGSLSECTVLIVQTLPAKIVFVNSPDVNFSSFGIGQTIKIQVSFDQVVNVTGTPELTLNSGANGATVTANYLEGTGTNILTFTYTVAAGETTSQLDYTLPSALTGTILDATGKAANLHLPAPGTPGSLANNKTLRVVAVAPKVVNVYSNFNGAIGTGVGFNIFVHFDSQVVVTGSADETPLYPVLLLSNGGKATFAKAEGKTLIFVYNPQGEESSLRLDYASESAILLQGASIRNVGGVDAIISLPAPGTVGSLSYNNSLVITPEVALAPSIAGVSSPLFQGEKGVGAVIPVTITFSRPVNVAGIPMLALNAGGSASASYVSGSGTRTLTFNYVVGAGQNTANLDFLNTSALTLNGGTIQDTIHPEVSAVLSLPVPGQAGSLGWSTRIVVDTVTTTTPQVINVTSGTTSTQAYQNKEVITIQVKFDRKVVVTGLPRLLLETGTTDAIATYLRGSGTDTLTFSYTVKTGQVTSLLDVNSPTALSLNGGTIKDAVNSESANLTLPTPSSATSLRMNKPLFVGRDFAQLVLASFLRFGTN
jgi:hypothetical protein